MELGPKQKQWLHNLRTYPERQGKFSLGEGTPESYTACCLGELLLVCGLGKFVNGKLFDNPEIGPNCKYLYNSYSELGLRDHGGYPIDNKGDSLAYMNDGGKKWPEIADIVEANPERYFTKSY